jgi:hypothetical protein
MNEPDREIVKVIPLNHLREIQGDDIPKLEDGGYFLISFSF